MMIHLREVLNKKDLKQFIMLPYTIHKNHKEWLPPLVSDEWKVFDKNKNHSFEHCDTLMLLAENEGQIVGRIMGIINHTYNIGHNEKNARFCFAETFDDAEVYDSLLGRVEKWAKKNGMEKMVGPIGFSDKDPQGYLFEGYEDPMTVIVTNCSFPYMITHTERNGYIKKLDLVQFRGTIPEVIPEFYNQVSERVLNRGFKILEFKKYKDIRQYVQPIFDLINETYTDIYGFAPLKEIEAKEFSERFLPFLDPRYIKIVLDKEEKMLAFVVAMPDISTGFRKANGKLFPLGFVHILKSMKKTTQLNLMLGCVKENIRNSGIDALLAVSLFESAKKGNLNIFDTHLVMEENTQMRAVYDRLKFTIYKKYRIFEKDL